LLSRMAIDFSIRSQIVVLPAKPTDASGVAKLRFEAAVVSRDDRLAYRVAIDFSIRSQIVFLPAKPTDASGVAKLRFEAAAVSRDDRLALLCGD